MSKSPSRRSRSRSASPGGKDKDRSSSRKHRRSRTYSRSPSPSACKRLHIANIDDSIRPRDIEDSYGKFGKLEDVWVATYPPFYAFVVYEHSQDAAAALKEMKSGYVRECHVRTSIALPRNSGRRGPPPPRRYEDRYSSSSRRRSPYGRRSRSPYGRRSRSPYRRRRSPSPRRRRRSVSSSSR